MASNPSLQIKVWIMHSLLHFKGNIFENIPKFGGIQFSQFAGLGPFQLYRQVALPPFFSKKIPK
jgi:hypothetical protein